MGIKFERRRLGIRPKDRDFSAGERGGDLRFGDREKVNLETLIGKLSPAAMTAEAIETEKIRLERFKKTEEFRNLSTYQQEQIEERLRKLKGLN